jgi:hypothetical protein
MYLKHGDGEECKKIDGQIEYRMAKFSKGERRKITFKNIKKLDHSWIGHIIGYNEFVV